MARKDYWTKREAEHQRKRIRDEKAYNAEIRKIYENMADIATKEINGFYAKYAAKEGITLAEAKRRISTADIAEYAKKAEKYVPAKDLSDKANEEMRLYNAMMSINRLEMLKSSIGLGMVDGFDELDQTMREHLTDAAEEEFVRQAGILGGTVRNPREAASTIVNSSFHNATFSQRIWMHQGMLRSELDKVLQEGLIKGESSLKLARHIKKVFGASQKDAERLMRTEMSRVYTEAQKESYDAAGYEDYTYIALGDACEICAPLDGKHFKVKQMRVGENAPPMHPNCRCSTAPYMVRTRNDSSSIDEEYDYLRNNLPREYKDDRIVGEPITPEQVDYIIEKAKGYGIQIGLQNNKTGNFDLYCGEFETLEKIIDHAGESLISAKKAGLIRQNKEIILMYDNVLGYNGDKSVIDIGAFAQTNGKTITLNKFMFDDTTFLKRQYKEAVQEHLFSEGTTYLNIFDHELGHIIDKNNEKLRARIVNELQKVADNANITLEEYVGQNLSDYAIVQRLRKGYCEIVPELYAAQAGSAKEFSKSIFRKVGVDI